MMYKLKNDGRDLIPVSEIESLVISDDPKAITVFRNFLVNALTTGAIKPRSSYGFPVDIGSHFKINEDSLDDLTDDLVREATQPRSITDFAKVVDPRKLKRWARNRMESEAKTAIKDAVLSGFLTQDDVRAFLGTQGIACEWVSIENAGNNSSQDNQQKSLRRNINPHMAASTEGNSIEKPAPRDKQRRQEKAIVEAVKKLGYDPKAIPKAKNGCKGVRSEVREQFTIPGELFVTINTFEGSWERARSYGDIKDAVNHPPSIK